MKNFSTPCPHPFSKVENSLLEFLFETYLSSQTFQPTICFLEFAHLIVDFSIICCDSICISCRFQSWDQLHIRHKSLEKHTASHRAYTRAISVETSSTVSFASSTSTSDEYFRVEFFWSNLMTIICSRWRLAKIANPVFNVSENGRLQLSLLFWRDVPHADSGPFVWFFG